MISDNETGCRDSFQEMLVTSMMITWWQILAQASEHKAYTNTQHVELEYTVLYVYIAFMITDEEGKNESQICKLETPHLFISNSEDKMSMDLLAPFEWMHLLKRR